MRKKRPSTSRFNGTYRGLLKARIAERLRARRTLKAQSLTAMIPNITTLLALCCGMTSIRFALLEKWDYAIVAVLVAAILDGLDGRLARLLNSASRFGAELDSFADFVGFGIAPALVMYLKGLSSWGETGWAITLFFAVCMCLRLARFNVTCIDVDMPAWRAGFSTGVPAPAGGFLALYPIIVAHAFPHYSLAQNVTVYAVIMLLASALMVSRIPTFTLKKIVIGPSFVMPFLLLLFIVIALLYAYPWHMLSFIGLIYILTIPVSMVCFRKMEKKWDAEALLNHQVRSS